jgi:ubiquinone/menaquinone biosynthesis C-methylase UbiE
MIEPALRNASLHLDVGCGPGAFLDWILKIKFLDQVYACDPDQKLLSIAQRRHPGLAYPHLREGCAVELPFANAMFDSVTSMSGLKRGRESFSGIILEKDSRPLFALIEGSKPDLIRLGL